MSISTIQPQKSGSAKSLFIYVAASLGVGLIVFLIGMLITNIQYALGKSVLTVKTPYGNAEVYLNGKLLGSTPLEFRELKPGENKVTIKTENNQEDLSLEVDNNSQVIIEKDLGISKTFSSGQIFWVEEDKSGTVASLISEPSNAYVFIDGTEVGKTPYSSNSLSEGGYDLRVEYPGYETQTARIEIKKGLTVKGSIKLFPKPTPDKLVRFEGNEKLYNGLINNPTITSDVTVWIKGLVYWNKTRGIALGEASASKENIFEFYVDYGGNLYDQSGRLITAKAEYETLKNASKGLYLGQGSNTDGISEQAKETLEVLGQVGSGAEVTIKATPTGWLRVRDLPNLNGSEVARVNVGSKYTLIEEKDGWVKIKVSESLQGWVSGDYVQKSETNPIATPTATPTTTLSPTPTASPSVTSTPKPTN